MIAALLAAWLSSPAAGAWFRGASQTMESPRRLYDAGRYSEVIAELGGEKLHRFKGLSQRQAYLYLGMAHEGLNQFDKALGVYQLGVRLYPRDLNLLSQLGVLLHRSRLEERAEPVFQKILSIHPNNYLANLGLAEIDHALGFLDRSAEHYERALEMVSDRPEVWRDYAALLLSLRDIRTGELSIRRSLALAETPESLLVLARLQRHDNRLDEALETLRRAADLDPARADVSLMRSLWLLEAGRDEESLALAEAALKAPSPEPLAYWIRARVNLKRDRYAAAVADLQKAAAEDRRARFTAEAAKELLKQLGAAR